MTISNKTPTNYHWTNTGPVNYFNTSWLLPLFPNTKSKTNDTQSYDNIKQNSHQLPLDYHWTCKLFQHKLITSPVLKHQEQDKRYSVLWQYQTKLPPTTTGLTLDLKTQTISTQAGYFPCSQTPRARQTILSVMTISNNTPINYHWTTTGPVNYFNTSWLLPLFPNTKSKTNDTQSYDNIKQHSHQLLLKYANLPY